MPAPDSLPDFKTRMAPYKDRMGEWYDRPRPIDIRYIDGDPFSRAATTPPTANGVWMRADGRLPDDPTLHACVVTYASDMTLLDTTVLPFGLSWDSPDMQMASLDHAMWFHRPFRADEWLLYDQKALSTSAGRGLAGGAIFTQRRHARRHRRAGGSGADRSWVMTFPMPRLSHEVGAIVAAVIVVTSGCGSDKTPNVAVTFNTVGRPTTSPATAYIGRRDHRRGAATNHHDERLDDSGHLHRHDLSPSNRACCPRRSFRRADGARHVPPTRRHDLAAN